MLYKANIVQDIKSNGRVKRKRTTDWRYSNYYCAARIITSASKGIRGMKRRQVHIHVHVGLSEAWIMQKQKYCSELADDVVN